MEAGALFVLILVFPLVFGWCLDCLLYIGNSLMSEKW